MKKKLIYSLEDGWFDPRLRLKIKIDFVNSEKGYAAFISKQNITTSTKIEKMKNSVN